MINSTLGTELGTSRSPISPILQQPRPNDSGDSIANWLPTWSPAELREKQLNDTALRSILDCKTLGEKPHLTKLTKPLYQQGIMVSMDNLEINEGVLYRKWADAKGNIIFQLVAPEVSGILSSLTFTQRV